MPRSKLGLVHVYTGEGKGKTTMSMGIALRAIGQNLKVCIVQFLKGGAYTGEFLAASNYLPNFHFKQFGKPCIKEKKQLKLNSFPNGLKVDFIREDIDCGDCRFCFLADKEEKLLARKAIEHADEITRTGDYDIIILDEINNAAHKGLIGVDEVLKIINNKYENTELILTGRNAPKEFIERADLVTYMQEIKHYFNKGIKARRGIEY